MSVRDWPAGAAYDLAMRYLGLHEKPGDAVEPFVALINRLAGGGETEDAWCGSFVYFIAAFNLGLESPFEPRRARDWLTVGVPVRIGGRFDPQTNEIAMPCDVIVLSRGPLPQPGPEVPRAPGHVGILAPDHAYGAQHGPDEIMLVSGNVRDAVTLAPFPLSRVLGARRLRRAPEIGSGSGGAGGRPVR